VTVTADGDEVEVPGVLVADEALWHSVSLEESGRASLDNPPFAVRLQRMGHPAVMDGPPRVSDGLRIMRN